MTKTNVHLHVEDLTVFARNMSRQLGPTSPSHLALMNMASRAAGFQNYQHLRSVQAAKRRLTTKTEPTPMDARAVERTLHQFDPQGRLSQWPAKRTTQTLALWAIWAILPSNTALTEAELNTHLHNEHCFNDVATLRRTMISCGLLHRHNDGTNYRRMTQKPPAEATALIRALSRRRAQRSTPE